MPTSKQSGLSDEEREALRQAKASREALFAKASEAPQPSPVTRGPTEEELAHLRAAKAKREQLFNAAAASKPVPKRGPGEDELEQLRQARKKREEVRASLYQPVPKERAAIQTGFTKEKLADVKTNVNTPSV